MDGGKEGMPKGIGLIEGIRQKEKWMDGKDLVEGERITWRKGDWKEEQKSPVIDYLQVLQV